MKKTDRIYTPVMTMKHFAEKIDLFGNKLLYKYFDRNKNLCEMTYSEFALLIKRIAAGFSSFGLEGKRVAIIGETSPEWVASYVAIIAMGGVAIPLDKDLQVKEIKGFLKLAKADALIYSRSFNKKLAELITDSELSLSFIPLDDLAVQSEKDKLLPFSELVKEGKAHIKRGFGFPELDDTNRFSVLLFTSGTTGTSKGVMLSERNVVASLNAACECVEFYYEDTIVSVLPIHHTYELCCMLAGINYGMTICINDTLLNVGKNIKLFQPTGIVLVPAFIKHMYKRILAEAEKGGNTGKLNTAVKTSKLLRTVGIDVRDFIFRDIRTEFGGRLVKIVSGGAPLNPEITQKFAEFGITICEGYGITECSPLVSVNPYFALKSGSVGPAVECCTTKIDGDIINNKGFLEGEILVKGDNVMLGYYGFAPEDNPIENGYFRTGDVGYMDKDGYIYITGRKKSVIISDNGKNVSPEELEEYLYELDNLLECVVLGRKDGEYHKVTITAVIYPNMKAFSSEKEALDYFRAAIKPINDKLPPYKKIGKVELRTIPFEKTTSQKIKRFMVS